MLDLGVWLLSEGADGGVEVPPQTLRRHKPPLARVRDSAQPMPPWGLRPARLRVLKRLITLPPIVKPLRLPETESPLITQKVVQDHTSFLWCNTGAVQEVV